MTDRELIRQLADALEVLQKETVTTPHNQVIVVGGVAHPIPIGHDLLRRDTINGFLISRTRAALAQPEPERPTVMQILALSDEIEAEELGTIDLVRRALARWGRPPIKPVPVSERLPGPEDSDAEGFCWWFSAADPAVGTFGVAACWVLRKHEPEDDDWRTHWLPHWAVPVPTGETP